ncbi:MAG: hypothetical protein AAB531_05655 [Patescibacteria group bacterium]
MKKLPIRQKQEGSEMSEKIGQLKLEAIDGYSDTGSEVTVTPWGILRFDSG